VDSPEDRTEIEEESDPDATSVTPPLTGDSTVSLVGTPEPASLALRAAGQRAPTPNPTTGLGTTEPLPTTPLPRGEISLTTAADAMRNEEIERTRLFIAMGWVISVIAAGVIPFVNAPRFMSVIFVSGLAFGMVYSFFAYRRFADPVNYTEKELLALAIICVINGHIGVMFFGTYSAAPVLVVVGIHFIGRTELQRVAYWIFITAVTCYSTIALVIITGIAPDPGVFASELPVPAITLAAATLFVLGTYVLAYHTARTFRSASLSSIDELQRATRLASQREALMEELRADLERALRVGGPGRYTDHTVGHYRLGIVLGRGAMGEVYEAMHVDTQAPAAVKLLRREQLADPTQVARFFREVRASAALESPHVVRVLDASAPEDPLPYLAMELLHGQTLGELLRREPKLTPGATLEILRHAGSGIDAAAAANIVHRDMKPQNLFRTADGVWKILDFGVATLLTDDSGTLTQGEAVGTPYYMAPEQAQGLRVDSRADLYALAAIAYRCLTGRYPFTAPDTPSLLYSVVHRTVSRPGALAELPGDVDRWFAIALAKSPDDRFSSGAALVEAFIAALEGALDGKSRKRADALIRKHPWEAA